jgi:IS5 family transposase
VEALVMAGQPGFFDVDERYAALSAAGDPLERLSAVVGFEIFRPVLETALARSDRSRGGRPPYDAVLMFRLLVLQALYSLSDEQAEFQLRDRLSFMRFAGLGLHQAVPDATTIWLYREQLKQAGAIEGLFQRFDKALAAKGLLAMGGQIIDATLIAAPRQKLTIEEKATIREGGTPEGWSRAKRAQKDRDARWTLKRGRAQRKLECALRQAIQIAVPLFGYKSHIGIDRRHGLIRRWTVTDAAQHTQPQLSGPAGSRKHGQPRLGRHRLSHQAQSGGSGTPWAERAHPVPQATETPTFRTAGKSQCVTRPDPLGHRAYTLPPRSTAWRCSSAPSAWPGHK